MTPRLIGPGSIRISSGRASNGKYYLVQQLDGFIHLYTIAGQFVRVLDRAIRTDTQPMLAWMDDDHVFIVEGNCVWRRSLTNDTGFELIKCFPEYLNLSEGRHAEGDLTRSGFMGLCGVLPDGGESVFTFNLVTGETGKPYPIRKPFDGLKVCDDGTMLVSGPLGILAISESRKAAYMVTEANGHACTAVDAGRSKLLWCSNDRKRGWSNAVELIDIEDPSDVRVLMDFGKKNYAMHLSAGPDDGFCSVYDPTDGLPNQIWRLPFNGSAGELLHEWRSPYKKDYEPRATYSEGLISYNVWNGQGSNVYALSAAEAATPPQEEGTPAAPSTDPTLEDRYGLIDYTPFEGRKFRLEQDLVARGGVLVATSTRMYEKI